MDEYLKMIDDCEQRESRLDEWSTNFLDSLKTQLHNGKWPREKQIEKLDEIWERATARG